MSHGETARLIPVAGIRGRQEAEDRANSALLAVLTVVRPFATVVLGMFGARIGRRAQAAPRSGRTLLAGSARCEYIG